MTQAVRVVGAFLLVSSVACGGTNSGTAAIPVTSSQKVNHTKTVASASMLARIVGVGDDFTAGYQAQGFLGQTGVPNAQSPGRTIPPTQESGWWADLDEEASGLPLDEAIAREYNPEVSPLPLIKGPGLNNQIVVSSPLVNVSKPGDSCSDDNGFDAAGYLLNGLPRVRMNPSSTTLRDLAVPGITLHEAMTLPGPQTSTCALLPGIPGLLSEVVADESSVFWPVLGDFAKFGQNLSMVHAAASLHPTLATVWLGANDVLKYMGSGGRFVGGDNSVAQASADIRDTVQTLQDAGAHVVVANLPNVLVMPFFVRADIPKGPVSQFGLPEICKIQAYAYCILLENGFDAKTYVSTWQKQYHLNTTVRCSPATTSAPCGYLTIAGVLDSMAYYLSPLSLPHDKMPNLDCTGANFTKPCVAGSGLGVYYITPQFAAKIQTLNNIVNAGVALAAKQTAAPLVNITAVFDGIASGNPSNPYFNVANRVSPGVCCTLTFSGGLMSFDGVHPSNTGYALLANEFITTLNRNFRTHVPHVDLVAAYKGTRCSNRAYCYPDPYAPTPAP